MMIDEAIKKLEKLKEQYPDADININQGSEAKFKGKVANESELKNDWSGYVEVNDENTKCFGLSEQALAEKYSKFRRE